MALHTEILKTETSDFLKQIETSLKQALEGV